MKASAPRIMWRGSCRKFFLPPAHRPVHGTVLMTSCSEEEDPDEYAFPLTLRTKRTGPGSPLDGVQLNGN